MASPPPTPVPRGPPNPTPPPTPPPGPPPILSAPDVKLFRDPGVVNAWIARNLDGTSEAKESPSPTLSATVIQQRNSKKYLSVSEIFHSLRLEYEKELALEETMMALCGELPENDTPADITFNFPPAIEPVTMPETIVETEQLCESPPPSSPSTATLAETAQTEAEAGTETLPAASPGHVVPSLADSVNQLTWFINFYMRFKASILVSKHLCTKPVLRPLLQQAQALVKRAAPTAAQAQEVLDTVSAWREYHEHRIQLAENGNTGLADSEEVVNPFAGVFHAFKEFHGLNNLPEEDYVQYFLADKTAEVLEYDTVGGIAEALLALNDTLGEYTKDADAMLEAKKARR